MKRSRLLVIALRLEFEGFSVGAAFLEELFVRAGFYYRSVFEHVDFARVSYCRKAVRDDNDCFVPDEQVDLFENFVLGCCVDGGGWLVEDEDGAIAVKHAGEGELLSLAGGEVGAAGELFGKFLVVAIIQFLNELCCICFYCSIFDSLL